MRRIENLTSSKGHNSVEKFGKSHNPGFKIFSGSTCPVGRVLENSTRPQQILLVIHKTLIYLSVDTAPTLWAAVM